MTARLPNPRHPRSFYDVFSVVAVAVAIVALVFTVRYGPVVQFEVVVFMTIVFLWAGWAINGILDQSTRRSDGSRPSSPAGKSR